MTSSYRRVLPRDLFNEAKLLKCLGQLSLMIHDGKCELRVEHSDELWPGFVISQDESDGGIEVVNLVFSTPNGTELRLKTGLNARESYPLFCELPDGDELEVFTEDGTLRQEFLRRIKDI